MNVDIPSDLYSSTIKMLMRDDDKCLSSTVCAALTSGRLLGWWVGRSKCATVWAAELQTFNSCEIFHVKFWKADWTVDHIIFFFTEFAKGKGQIWSIMGARGLRDGGLHHYFQKLKSTPLYSLYCLTACTIWRRSLVWWIMETKPDETLCLDFFCRRSTCISWFSVQVRLFLHLPHSI